MLIPYDFIQYLRSVPLIDGMGVIAALSAAVAAWLSWKSSSRAAKAAEVAAQRTTRIEGLRAAHSALADSLIIDTSRGELESLYNGMFARAGVHNGSAHKQTVESANRRARRVGELNSKIVANIDQLSSPEPLSDDVLLRIVVECISHETHIRRVRGWFDREIGATETRMASWTSDPARSS